MYAVTGYIDFRGVACNSNKLAQYVTFDDRSPASSEEISRALCSLNEDDIEAVVEAVQQHLDIKKISEAVRKIIRFLSVCIMKEMLSSIKCCHF